jgi:hypothetical protein
MLWSKRRSSRFDPNTHRTQVQPQLSPPRRPSLPPNSNPRLPLAPLDPLDPQASQSSITAAAEDMSSSHHSSSSDDDPSALKHRIGRQIDREALDKKASRYVRYSFLSLFASSLTLFTSDHPLLHHHVVHSQIKLVEARFPHLMRPLRTVPPLARRRACLIRLTRIYTRTILYNRFHLDLFNLNRHLTPSIPFRPSRQMPTTRVMSYHSHVISHLALQS